MVMPEGFYLGGDFRGDFYAGFALGPIDFRYSIIPGQDRQGHKASIANVAD